MTAGERLRSTLRQWCGTLVLGGLRHFGSRPFVLTKASVLVVAPHPDDETLGCGGLIALKREQGSPVHVVFLTDGGDAPVRYAEACSALQTLGVSEANITFLGAPDGSLAAWSEPSQAALVAQLSDLLFRLAPGELFLPHRADVHTDHEAAYQLLQEAVAHSGTQPVQWQYAIWLLWWKPILFVSLPLKMLAGAHRLPIHRVWAKKQSAISLYPSQLTDHILPRAFLRRFAANDELFYSPPQ